MTDFRFFQTFQRQARGAPGRPVMALTSMLCPLEVLWCPFWACVPLLACGASARPVVPLISRWCPWKVCGAQAPTLVALNIDPTLTIG